MLIIRVVNGKQKNLISRIGKETIFLTKSQEPCETERTVAV